MIQALRNAMVLPDLRRKLLYTLLILVVYRLASHVPVPGVDQAALQQLLSGSGGASDFFNLLNMLSGGAVTNFSVMANGVYPYITASIIFSLLQPIFPKLEQLAGEGEAGRRKLNQWQYYITIPLGILQAFGQATGFNYAGSAPILPHFGFGSPENILPTISVLMAMTAGTMFAIWLGELITEQGIGSGLSLIIFGGIVAGVPQNVARVWVQSQATGGAWQGVLMVGVFLAIMVITMFVIVVVQEGERRVPVQYGKRVRGIKMYQGGSTHIPLRVNTSGMIPLIFAQSILTFPAMIASFFVGSENVTVVQFAQGVRNFFTPQGPWYGLLYFLAVVGFTYFYTDIMIQQQDLPGALKRQGGFIPGIRPGKRTADYITSIYRRITLVGALFLGGVAVLPYIVDLFLQTKLLLITSSGLLIVVGVVLDTMRQLEAQLLMRHYDGFIK
ncbi:MAG: preprotein translocase subunit SecY [Anaerolineaceae bacterium 4572_32.2]|nr:MAG: preprotein translocase subunit SecY [Anaerolineaceae bacterium 4572_32.2]RLC81503.1 MAG: preprotein translocase subunit SecY [Chloroflexota bacterium]HEY74047.1 preprotein translocase subunit SecY [Thermoflexia bacterium]